MADILTSFLQGGGRATPPFQRGSSSKGRPQQQHRIETMTGESVGSEEARFSFFSFYGLILQVAVIVLLLYTLLDTVPDSARTRSVLSGSFTSPLETGPRPFVCGGLGPLDKYDYLQGGSYLTRNLIKNNGVQIQKKKRQILRRVHLFS